MKKSILTATLLVTMATIKASQKDDTEDLSMSVYMASIQALSKPATCAPQLLPQRTYEQLVEDTRLLVVLHDQKDARIIQLQKELLQHQEALSDSQKDIKSKSGLIEILEKRCKLYEGYLQSKDTQMAEQEAHYNKTIAVRAIHNACWYYLAKKKQAQLKNATTEIANLQAYKDGLIHINIQLRKTLDDELTVSASRIEARDIQIKEKDAQITALEASLEHFKKASETFKGVASVLQKRADTFEAENARLKEQIQNLEFAKSIWS